MSVREIGSEFWDVPTAKIKNSVFGADLSWYLSGRSALSAIIEDIARAKKIRRVLLPSWCCESMIAPFVDVGADIMFYGVLLSDCKIAIDYPQNTEADVVVVMDYFGYSIDAFIPNYDSVIIRDITHSVFSREYNDADYYFGSLRKWAGFYTGGFARKQNGNLPKATVADERYISLRKRAMSMKKEYIECRSDVKDYLDVFSQAESLLDKTHYVFAADADDVKRAEYFDVDYIKRKRRDNAQALLSRLGELSLFALNDGDCPLFVPIALSNRDEVRAELISHSVYCPCHWGLSELHALSRAEKRIYECELSLVCDHRYGINDMNRICDIVERTAKAC